MNEDLSPEQRRILANEARQLLDNKHFKEAFSAVDAYLESQAIGCSPDDKDKAQRIVLSKQLLQAIRREIMRQLDDGFIAEVQMAEIERKRGLLRFMR